MAAGTVKSTDIKRSIKLLDAQTTNTSIPTLSTDGFACYPTKVDLFEDAAESWCFYHDFDAGQSTLCIKGTVNAGQTLVGTFTLWGYLAEADTWFEIPVNGGTSVTPVALAETDTDKITFTQRFENLGHFDRLALQLTSVGGTGASFSAWLVTGKYAA